MICLFRRNLLPPELLSVCLCFCLNGNLRTEREAANLLFLSLLVFHFFPLNDSRHDMSHVMISYRGRITTGDTRERAENIHIKHV